MPKWEQIHFFNDNFKIKMNISHDEKLKNKFYNQNANFDIFMMNQL